MADNLFEGLPPPSAELHPPQHQREEEVERLYPKTATAGRKSSPLPAPDPVLKSALKRPKPVEPNPDGNSSFFFNSNSLASEIVICVVRYCFSSLFLPTAANR